MAASRWRSASPGYDAVSREGSGEEPGLPVISSHDVRLRDATPLWGCPKEETGRILRENEVGHGGGKRIIIRIGRPARPSAATRASTSTPTGTSAGWDRRGDGREATQGDRRRGRPVVPDRGREALRAAYTRVHELATRSSAMQKYHELGHAAERGALNALGGLPTRNLRRRRSRAPTRSPAKRSRRTNLLRSTPASAARSAASTSACCGRSSRKATSTARRRLVRLRADLRARIGARRRRPKGVLDPDRGRRRDWARRDVGGRRSRLADRGAAARGWSRRTVASRSRSATFPGYLKAIDQIVARSNELWETPRRGTARCWPTRTAASSTCSFAATRSRATTPVTAQMLGHVVGARHSHLDAAGYSLDQCEARPRPERIRRSRC